MGRVNGAVNPTRERLINTAERLYALHGLDGVSLDRIRREAGEKNASALQYHFGNKRALLRAVFETRLNVIDRRRFEILKASKFMERAEALRGCASALVLPVAEHLSTPGAERYYVRFVAQVYGDPRTDWLELFAGGRNEGIFQVGRMLAELLPDLPRDVIRARLELVVGLIIHGLADREKVIAANARPPVLATPVFVSLLVDVCVGALSSPCAGTTQPKVSDGT